MTGPQSALAAAAADPASLVSSSHSAGVMPWSCMSAQIHREQTPTDETQPRTMGLLLSRRRETCGLEKDATSAAGGVCQDAWMICGSSMLDPAASLVMQIGIAGLFCD